MPGETTAPTFRLQLFSCNRWPDARVLPTGAQSPRLTADRDLADVERVLMGDASAFEGIVLRWQGPLVNLAYRFCRDRGRAEDMAQEAFLRAYRALGSWRRQGSFSTWLFATATNVFRNELRRIPARTVAIEEAHDVKAVDADVEQRLRDDAVRRAVLALPAKYREALTLFYFHEMDLAAAACSLGVPEGTLKARLFRGREILRRRFR